MKSIFLILGYGLPRNIIKDENYNFYLKTVFNNIFDLVNKNKIQQPLLIFCGGRTDCFRPYQRTEVEEMKKLFQKLAKRRVVKKLTASWQLKTEKRSLSTLENLLNSQQIISQKIKAANIHIFCEKTRAARIKTLARKIFAKKYKITVWPVDFDVSANRYLDLDFIQEKEVRELKHCLWALKNLKKHHQLFREKVKYLRQAGPEKQVTAVRELWQRKY